MRIRKSPKTSYPSKVLFDKKGQKSYQKIFAGGVANVLLKKNMWGGQMSAGENVRGEMSGAGGANVRHSITQLKT